MNEFNKEYENSSAIDWCKAHNISFDIMLSCKARTDNILSSHGIDNSMSDYSDSIDNLDVVYNVIKSLSDALSLNHAVLSDKNKYTVEFIKDKVQLSNSSILKLQSKTPQRVIYQELFQIDMDEKIIAGYKTQLNPTLINHLYGGKEINKNINMLIVTMI